MADPSFDPDVYTKMTNLTKRYYRDVYPAISPTSPKNSAADKIILITDSSRGLGRAIAVAYAHAGAAGIIVTARKQEDLVDVQTKIGEVSGGKTKVLAVAVELPKPGDVERLFKEAKSVFGKLDIVVANAGIMAQGKGYPKIGELGCEEWWSDLEVNLRGVHLTAHHYITTFGPTGTFITMTSSLGTLMIPGNSSYGLSKLSCIRIVEYLDAEYPELRTFSLNPGIVKGLLTTPAFLPFAQDTPELIGAMAVWLGTPAADGVRGGYVGVNWDVEDLERHGEEIRKKGLLKMQFYGEVLGPDGYAFGK